MSRSYSGPTIVKGRVVRKAGESGQPGQPTPHATPKFKEERPAPIASPHLGRGEARAPKPREPEPHHSVMRPPEKPAKGEQSSLGETGVKPRELAAVKAARRASPVALAPKPGRRGFGK